MFSSHSRSNTPKNENNKNQSNLPHDGVKYIDYNEKVQKILNELLDNFPDISVILLSTSEGVPLLIYSEGLPFRIPNNVIYVSLGSGGFPFKFVRIPIFPV